VVKHQAVGTVSPPLTSRQGIDGELQTLIRIFLRTWFAGLVINNSNMFGGDAADTIDAPHDLGFTDSNLEFLLGVKDLDGRLLPLSSQEISQLLDILLLVQPVLPTMLYLSLAQ